MQNRLLLTLFSALIAAPVVSQAEQDGYDYFAANREQIRNGVQAVLMCKPAIFDAF